MGHQGRYGKYGETKRFARLRQSGMRESIRPTSESRPWARRPAPTSPRDSRGHVHIRDVLLSDETFIRQLSSKVFSIYGPYSDMVRRWFSSDTTVTLIALLEGQPVGFAMFGMMEGGGGIPAVAELLAIAVEPEKHHRGIGQTLLKEIEEEAAMMGEKRLSLHTATENRAAQKLFIKNGYRPFQIKRNFYPKGQDALMMIKEITGLG